MRREAPVFQPKDPGYADRVRASFGRQRAMQQIGACLLRVEPGFVELELPCREDITQQHGYIHGGIVGMIADSAGGFAANSLVEADASVLTVEYKLNLVAPAAGERLVARGEVSRPGRTLIVTCADVFAVQGDDWNLCAVMQQTVMVLPDKAGCTA